MKRSRWRMSPIPSRLGVAEDGRGECLGDRPAAVVDARGDGEPLEPGSFGPLREAQPQPLVFEDAVGPGVACLLGRCGPAAVARAVVAAVVDAVNLVGVAGRLAHVL